MKINHLSAAIILSSSLFILNVNALEVGSESSKPSAYELTICDNDSCADEASQGNYSTSLSGGDGHIHPTPYPNSYFDWGSKELYDYTINIYIKTMLGPYGSLVNLAVPLHYYISNGGIYSKNLDIKDGTPGYEHYDDYDILNFKDICVTGKTFFVRLDNGGGNCSSLDPAGICYPKLHIHTKPC